jgi:hypothetical protein
VSVRGIYVVVDTGSGTKACGPLPSDAIANAFAAGVSWSCGDDMTIVGVAHDFVPTDDTVENVDYDLAPIDDTVKTSS